MLCSSRIGEEDIHFPCALTCHLLEINCKSFGDVRNQPLPCSNQHSEKCFHVIGLLGVQMSSVCDSLEGTESLRLELEHRAC